MGPRATKDVVEWLLGQLEGDEEALIDLRSVELHINMAVNHKLY